MKKLSTIFGMLFLTAFIAKADCEVRIGVGPMEAGEIVAPGIESQLESKLQRALTRQGVMASGQYSQFFITGRFDSSYSDMVGGGTSNRYVVKTDLTLYIADQEGQVYASQSFPMKGVGDSEERAYIKCLGSLSPNDKDFVRFVQEAKDKIVSYFDDNYQAYLTKAQTAMTQRNYAEAMYYAGIIPECCRGFESAQNMLITAYKHATDYDAQTLLAKAEAAWGANPNENGALEALGYLAAIDPAASCYPQAQKLTNKITNTVRGDFEFENRTKYQREMDLEQKRIEAARAVGIAWAQNQPKTVYKTNFVVRHHYHHY